MSNSGGRNIAGLESILAEKTKKKKKKKKRIPFPALSENTLCLGGPESQILQLEFESNINNISSNSSPGYREKHFIIIRKLYKWTRPLV